MQLVLSPGEPKRQEPKLEEFNAYVLTQEDLVATVGRLAGKGDTDINSETFVYYEKFADVWRTLVYGMKLKPKVAESLLLSTLFQYLMHDEHMGKLAYALGEDKKDFVSFDEARQWAVNHIAGVDAEANGVHITIKFAFDCVHGDQPFIFQRTFTIDGLVDQQNEAAPL